MTTQPADQRVVHRADGNPCFHAYFHGLTCAEYDGLAARANGHCEICGTAEEDTARKWLVIDHFHAEERRSVSFIRGMLCDRCNAVMACVDGMKAWGENRKWEAAARAYERNGWQQPSEEALRLMAARTEMPPKPVARGRRWPRPIPAELRPDSIELPLRQGSLVIAMKLRRYLSPRVIATLAELLAENGG